MLLEDRSPPQKAVTNGPAKETPEEEEPVVRLSNYSGSWEEVRTEWNPGADLC